MGWKDTVDDVLRETWTVDDGNVVRADAYNYLESRGGESREIEARATVAAAAPDLYRALLKAERHACTLGFDSDAAKCIECGEFFDRHTDTCKHDPKCEIGAALRKARGE